MDEEWPPSLIVALLCHPKHIQATFKLRVLLLGKYPCHRLFSLPGGLINGGETNNSYARDHTPLMIQFLFVVHYSPALCLPLTTLALAH